MAKEPGNAVQEFGSQQGWVPEVNDKTKENEKGVKAPQNSPLSTTEVNAKVSVVGDKIPETPIYPWPGVDVYEPSATISGYLQPPGEDPKERPYLVHADSALSTPPWNVEPGFVQGRTGNPGLPAGFFDDRPGEK